LAEVSEDLTVQAEGRVPLSISQHPGSGVHGALRSRARESDRDNTIGAVHSYVLGTVGVEESGKGTAVRRKHLVVVTSREEASDAELIEILMGKPGKHDSIVRGNGNSECSAAATA
jgi:hypothetical protein